MDPEIIEPVLAGFFMASKVIGLEAKTATYRAINSNSLKTSAVKTFLMIFQKSQSGFSSHVSI